MNRAFQKLPRGLTACGVFCFLVLLSTPTNPRQHRIQTILPPPRSLLSSPATHLTVGGIVLWYSCSRWVQNKWLCVTDLTGELLGRLTERVGPSGPLNETQPEEGEVEGGGEWHRAAIESYFHLPPQLIYPRPPLNWGPRGHRRPPAAAAPAKWDWSRGGSKPSQENPVCLEKVNFSRMKKNEAVFKWVSQLFHSDAKDSVMVFVAVKDDQHIKKLH